MTTMPETPAAELPERAEDSESLIALLRTKRKRQAMQRTRVFELPGYAGLLGARLRTANEREVLADANVMLGNANVSDEDAADLFNARRLTIASACIEIVSRKRITDKKWTPLAETLNDGKPGAVVFGPRLVEALGAEPGEITAEDGAVGALKYVVSKPLPFLGLYSIYAEWCAVDEPLDDDELVGESSAAR